ncbi:group-specific protein [Guptibacillus hwajinpoensis]|uniref:Group-specific protein n=1 Tax=Guptibacillus hwajinpoensis TaxID=208199 RepID=A0A0J6CQT3_9BACL|nr:group-specific protein [Alkalihalobacillus macyae]KMM38616.1 group-specific protein [Alkalihalobacillus macyae]
MLNIQIDDQEAKQLYLQKVEEKIKQIDAERVFWDAKELQKRTCMSWGSIQEKFFFDSRFKKYKVGQKWYFPAGDTKDFLLTWLSEQNTR